MQGAVAGACVSSGVEWPERLDYTPGQGYEDGMHQGLLRGGREKRKRNFLSNQEVAFRRNGGAEGDRTSTLTSDDTSTCIAEPQQIRAKPSHSSALADSTHSASEHKCAPPQQNPDRSVHEKCVPSVHQGTGDLPEDLVRVVEAWPSLPDKVKAGIMAMIEADR